MITEWPDCFTEPANAMRYMHATVETVHCEDAVRFIRLVCESVHGIDSGKAFGCFGG